MARPLRFQFPGAWYHIMNRGANRQGIFLDKEDGNAFFRVLGSAVYQWRICIHAYSLMSNHYHLLLETPEGNLSRAMRHIDGVYTQRFNRKYKKDGPLFRGRFKSILIDQDSYLLELVRYIHLNGVRSLQYLSAREDPYTSHRVYIGIQDCPPWLTTRVILKQFHPHRDTARRILDEFVQKGVPQKLEETLQRQRWPAVLGSKCFLQKVKEEFLNGDALLTEQPQAKEIRKLEDPKELIDRVARKYGVSLEAITRRNSSKDNEARWVAMYLLSRVCLLTYREIGVLLGGVGRGSVAPICQKMEASRDKWVAFAEEIL